MLNLIFPIGAVLISWLLFFLLFSGLGIIALGLLGRPLLSGSIWLDSFWLGWALALGILQLWHLAFPVDDLILFLFGILAASMLFWKRHEIMSILQRTRHHVPLLLMFGVMLLWMSSRSIEMPTAFDTGFRDMQAVLWMDSYPIVPGLSNLFSSLAYNHSVYLYDALLDVSFWSGRSYHIATGLLVIVYLAYALRAAAQLYRCRDDADLRWSSIFATLTIPFIMFYTVRLGGISHFLTDSAVELIGFLAMLYLLDFVQYGKPGGKESHYLIFRLAIIILAGFTVKQTFIVYGLGLGALALVIWLRRGGRLLGNRFVKQIMLPLAALAIFFVIPWMVRGVVASGYVAYPHSFGRFEVDWALSAEHLESRQLMLANNTRERRSQTEDVAATLDWLGPWLQDFARNTFSSLLPTVISVVSLTLYSLGFMRHRGSTRTPSLGPWILLPLLVLLIVWFFSFPNLKYVKYVIWSFAALSVTMTVLVWTSVPWRLRRLSIFAVTCLSLAYVLFLIIRLGSWPLPAGPNDGFYARRIPPYRTFVTDHGVTINETQGYQRQCWLVPLPCTPFPREGLYERVPGDLWHGFGYQELERENSADA